jgi:hypothetical protein
VSFTRSRPGALALAFAASAALSTSCSSTSEAPGKEGGAPDSTREGAEYIDTNAPLVDSSPYAWNDSAPSCQPASPSGFSPVAISPAKRAVCTAGQIADLTTDCYAPGATSAACAAWHGDVANMMCFDACPVVSTFAASPALKNPPPSPSGPWGPLVSIVTSSSITFVNLGGCLAAADPSSAAQDCAQAINAQFECEYYACAANCPIPSEADASTTEDALGAFQNCMLSADSGPCASYASAADACEAKIPASSPGEFCLNGSLLSANPVSFNPAFEQLVGDQCGGKPSSDGGPDDGGRPEGGDSGPDAD